MTRARDASPAAADSSAALPDARWLAAFRRRALAWFARNRRDLPWRRTRDPYAVWLSEIMLQQTQVATVIPYFERFLTRLPTVEALAAAEEDEVLRLWEGLGYYRRARQLHAAARKICDEHGGRFPDDLESVLGLPGIGRYTAGAILSIAFDQPQPILEANTIRLHSRLLAYAGDVASSSGQRLLWAMAEALLPRRQPGMLNQSLMELGSLICTPAPQCRQCPAAALCPTNLGGLQAEIPRPKPKVAFTPVHEAAVIVRRRGKVLLVRCPPGARWAGLWDFPRFAIESESPVTVERELIEKLEALTGVEARLVGRLRTLRHGVTRFRITLDCYEAECRRETKPAGAPEMRWLRPDELDGYPLNSTARKLARDAITPPRSHHAPP